MGHLINPTALRLGWKLNWMDNIYSDKLYYPEHLHTILRLRYLLSSLFGVWNMKSRTVRKLKASILYSHFIINQNVHGLEINIYYYDGILQYSWYNFIDDISNSRADKKHWFSPKKYRRIKTKIRLQRLNFYQSRHFFLFLLFYQWFNNYKYSISTDLIWHIRSNLFLSTDTYKNINTPDINKVGLVLFHNIIRRHINKSKEGSPRSIISKLGGINYDTICKIIYMISYVNIITKPVLYITKNYISLLCFIVTKGNFNIKTNLFLIDNDQVTANFLAKYMAARFKQDYTILDVINPLTRELKFMKKESLSKIPEILQAVRPNSFSNFISTKNRIKMHISNLTLLYNNKLNSFFNVNNVLITMDMLITMDKTIKIQKNNDLDFTFLFSNMRTFFCKKLQILIFLKNINNKYYALFAYFSLKKSNKNNDLFFILREIYDDIFNNFTQIASSIFGKKINSRLLTTFSYGNLMNLSVKCQYEYLKFNFWKFKLTRQSKLLRINKKKLRNSKIEVNGLRGYKIQLKGRFSRKQIASNLTFVGGSVPLNTLMGKIDYAFATIPLRNSAISVKVWLYKQGNTTNYFLKTV